VANGQKTERGSSTNILGLGRQHGKDICWLVGLYELRILTGYRVLGANIATIGQFSYWIRGSACWHSI
jgi:hypothetical protein